MPQTWSIKDFDDYHEITENTPAGWKSVELGCFPVMKYGYCRYFGLFYKGRKPSVAKIMGILLQRVYIGEFFVNGMDASETEISLQIAASAAVNPDGVAKLLKTSTKERLYMRSNGTIHKLRD